VDSRERASQKQPKPRGLLGFDVNGTLFDDAEQFFRTLNDIFLTLGQKPRSANWLRQHFMVAPEDRWTSIYRVNDRDVLSQEELLGLYNRIYQQHCRETPPPLARGAAQSLAELHESGYCLIVISAQENVVTKPMLEAAGVSDIFTDVHGGSEKKDVVLTETRKHLRLRAAETIFVGDQISDGRMAASAGVGFIHRAGGVHTRAQISQALSASLHSVRDFRGLPRLVKGAKHAQFHIHG